MQALANASFHSRRRLDTLLRVAVSGLPSMHRKGVFGHTLRSVRSGSQWGEQLEGDNLRYAAIVALGLNCVPEEMQQQILGFGNAAELAQTTALRAESASDIGAVALAAWAAGEVGQYHPSELFLKLRDRLAADVPIATVDCAWALTAALAGWRFGHTWEVAGLAHKKLLSGWSGSGAFPHMLPPSAAGRLRAHIGSFADQVYPIQALARLHATLDDRDALAVADACAERICALQGEHGQWWWHYDARNGAVAEGYPVYSVHQHAMAPMAMLELREAGGKDHLAAIVKGLAWLDERPETSAQLVNSAKGVIWRKVARREPNKAVRAVAAVTTAISPGMRIPGLDILFPPTRIDYECRPYELGWLLYAWLANGVIAGLVANKGLSSTNVTRGG